ncbi:MAG TPA: branched-chain amino acid ABC transporter permease [Burkholderiaceae bacterium]|nr:branched-chain amino acid ABC transporter permease [Burkholderiaceae bacterium]
MLSQEKTLNGERPAPVALRGAARGGRAAASGSKAWMGWLAGAVVLALLVALPWVAPYFYIFIATEVLILGLLAASFNLVFGYTGMLSFGHAAFFGIGSYAVAMLLQAYQWPLLACLLVAVIVAMLLALTIGFFCVRLNEVYFAMLTLAFGMMVFSIAHQWRSVTNGSDGIAGFMVGSFGLGLDLQLGNPSVYYHVVLVIVLLAAALLYLICRSSFGLILRAIRQNPERVAFCGVNVRVYRLASFTVAGAFAGLAGGLMAPFLRIASPELLHWSMSAEPVLMTILGGSGYFLGPFVGAAMFVLLETWITSMTQAWMLVLGIILAFMVMFFRRGLLGTLLDWIRERK